MAIRLDTRSADFAQRFRAFLDGKRETSADVEAAVRAIVADVMARGDRALQEYTQKFDRLDLDRAGVKVTPEDIAAALRDCAPAALDALKLARDRIEVFHRRQIDERLDRTLADALPEFIVFRANLLFTGMSRPFDSKCSELLHSDFDRAIDAVRGVERYPQAGYGGAICRADGPQSQS